MNIRKEASTERPTPDARDLPNVVELGDMPTPVRELFARHPAIEDRHPCAVFFQDMVKFHGDRLSAAEKDGLFRPLDPAQTREVMEFFKKTFPRCAIGGPTYRFDFYARYLLALTEVRQLARTSTIPVAAIERFMDVAATLVDAISRARVT